MPDSADNALPSFEDTQSPVSTQAPTASPTALPTALPTASPTALPTYENTDTSLPTYEDTAGSKDEAYTTPGQQVGTAVEGLAQGVAGPLATLAETHPLGISPLGVLAEAVGKRYGVDLNQKLVDFMGTNPEQVAGRAEANPGIHGVAETVGLIGGLATGEGEAGMIANAAEHIAPKATGVLGKIGSAALKGAITNGTIQGGDEISKYLLGQKDGDPNAVAGSVMAITGASILGAASGGIFNAVEQGTDTGLKALANKTLTMDAYDFLAGVGHKANIMSGKVPPEVEQMLDQQWRDNFKAMGKSPKAFQAGAKAYQTLMKKVISGPTIIGAQAGAYTGYEKNGVLGAITGGATGAATGMVFGLIGSKASGYVAAGCLKALSENSQTVPTAIKYAKIATQATKTISNNLDYLFKTGGSPAINAISNDAARQRIKDYINEGGLSQQIQNQYQHQQQTPPGFAEGGQVETAPPPIQPQVQSGPDHLATLYPEQAMLLGSAKTRIFNHLSSLKPQKPVGKPIFDEEMTDPAAERRYNRAIDLAIQPLGILEHIKQGTITPEHVQDMSAMFPELTAHLQKKLTERIMQSKLDEEKPSYLVRQGLSMFMGSPLDSTMTQPNIAAAQAVFATQKIQQAATQAPKPKKKKDTAELSKTADLYQTADQSAEVRAQQKG